MSKDTRYNFDLKGIDTSSTPSLDNLNDTDIIKKRDRQYTLSDPVMIFIQQRPPVVESIPIKTNIGEKKS